MAASTSPLDKFRHGASGISTTLGAPAISAGDTSMAPASVTNIPTITAVDITIDRVDSSGNLTPTKMERIIGVVSGGNIVAMLRGQDNTSAQAHSVGAVIEMIPTGKWSQDLVNGILVNHDQAGNHKALTDTNGNPWIDQTATASAVNRIQVANSATGNGPALSAVGSDTNIDLNHNTKGSGVHYFNSVPFDPTYSFFNALINSGCQVAQRSAPSLSTSYQYGQVDRFAAKGSGTAVSAGTITQTTTPNVISTGYAIKLSGMTITGAGVAYLRYRMEAKDALKFKNGAASFSCKVYHDVGSSINFTIYIRKANSADNFTAVTDIANSGAISVSTATATTIKFENINSGNLGDVSNGIEIEVQAAVGAITTKNIEFAEFQFNRGNKAMPFTCRNYEAELAACQRYYLEISRGTTYNGLSPAYVGTNVTWTNIPTPVTMRTSPTLTATALVTRYGGSDTNWTSPSVVGVNPIGVNLTGTTTGTTNGNAAIVWNSSGNLFFDAEL